MFEKKIFLNGNTFKILFIVFIQIYYIGRIFSKGLRTLSMNSINENVK